MPTCKWRHRGHRGRKGSPTEARLTRNRVRYRAVSLGYGSALVPSTSLSSRTKLAASHGRGPRRWIAAARTAPCIDCTRAIVRKFARGAMAPVETLRRRARVEHHADCRARFCYTLSVTIGSAVARSMTMGCATTRVRSSRLSSTGHRLATNCASASSFSGGLSDFMCRVRRIS